MMHLHLLLLVPKSMMLSAVMVTIMRVLMVIIVLMVMGVLMVIDAKQKIQPRRMKIFLEV
jgi:F0F1-type ATP synthase membrane subunit a